MYQLTHAQKRIWYTEMLHQGQPVNNIGGRIVFSGKFDFDLMEKAFNIFLNKNDGMRTQLSKVDPEPMQYIQKYKYVKVDIFDLSHDTFDNWANIQAKKLFELYDSPLYYFAICRLTNGECSYLIKIHHIIGDGWALNIFTKKIVDIYISLLSNENIDESVEYSIIGYLNSESEYLETNKFHKNKEYWHNKFKNLQPKMLSKYTKGISANRLTYSISQAHADKIREFAKQTNHTIYNIFMAGISLYMFVAKNTHDIIIGTPLLNRSNYRERNTFAMFVSTMPFRITINEKENAMNFLDRIKLETKDCMLNQRYPYDLLCQDLHLSQKKYSGLFQVSVNYTNTTHTLELNKMDVETIEFFNGHVLSLLEASIKDWDGEDILIDYNYNAQFHAKSIYNMHSILVSIIDFMIDNPHMQIQEILGLSINSHVSKMKKVLTNFLKKYEDEILELEIVDIINIAISDTPTIESDVLSDFYSLFRQVHLCHYHYYSDIDDTTRQELESVLCFDAMGGCYE